MKSWLHIGTNSATIHRKLTGHRVAILLNDLTRVFPPTRFSYGPHTGKPALDVSDQPWRAANRSKQRSILEPFWWGLT